MFCDYINPQDVPVVNVSALLTHTDFTLAQLTEYVQRHIGYKCSEKFTYNVIMPCFAITGFIGILAYFFMLASLNKSKLILGGSSMIYHKAIVLFELPHMLI